MIVARKRFQRAHKPSAGDLASGYEHRIVRSVGGLRVSILDAFVAPVECTKGPRGLRSARIVVRLFTPSLFVDIGGINASARPGRQAGPSWHCDAVLHRVAIHRTPGTSADP